MPELKRISPQSIPAALEKALRYRLLNEPLVAESICQDVLAVEPGNQAALVTLLLSLTDQFDRESVGALSSARKLLSSLDGEYERAYFEGIIHERWARTQASQSVPRHVVGGWLLQAMHCYEAAMHQAPADNPDAILRWNTCARWLDRFQPAENAPTSVLRDLEGEYSDDAPAGALPSRPR